MNLDKPLYARITINNHRTSLGRGKLAVLLTRTVEVYRLAKYHGAVSIQMEMSQDPLPENSTLDPVSQARHRMAELIAPPSDESPFPGITNARVAEAIASPEYSLWHELCKPDKRIGIDESIINNARDAYRAAYPDCFDHFPKWVES